MTKMLPAVAVAVAALTLSACGGSGSGGESSASSSSAPPQGAWSVSNCASLDPPTTGAPVPADAVVEGEVATTADLSTAHTVAVLEGAVAISSLVVSDVVAGSGDEVPAGATVTVEYCGVGLDSGAIFYSSWARGTPATFPLS